jgi:hypothetical protein
MDLNMLSEGLKIVEQASHILESISNEPGVTPIQFYAALDSRGILEDETRGVLMQAAATVEMTLELITDISNPTVH